MDSFLSWSVYQILLESAGGIFKQ